eukprot:g2779.t1
MMISSLIIAGLTLLATCEGAPVANVSRPAKTVNVVAQVLPPTWKGSKIRRPDSICSAISKHLPDDCTASSDCFHIDCEFELLNYSIDANLDLFPCGGSPEEYAEAYVTMRVALPQLHVDWHQRFDAGHDFHEAIPGASVDLPIPHFGDIGVGVYADVDVSGNIDELDLKVGVDVCGEAGKYFDIYEEIRLATGSDPSVCTVPRFHVDELTKSDFQATHRSRSPVVIVGALTKEWALSKWNREALHQAFGDDDVFIEDPALTTDGGVAIATLSLRDYVSRMNSFYSPSLDADRQLQTNRSLIIPYSFTHFTPSEWPAMVKEFSTPSMFDFMDDAAHTHQFTVGPLGSGLFWHKHEEAWSGVISGRKMWFLQESSPLGTTKEHCCTTSIWHSKFSAENHTEIPMQCTLGPGDAMYVPGGFFHATINLGDVVSKSQRLVSEGKIKSGSLHTRSFNAQNLNAEMVTLSDAACSLDFGVGKKGIICTRRGQAEVTLTAKEFLHNHFIQVVASGAGLSACKLLDVQETESCIAVSKMRSNLGILANGLLGLLSETANSSATFHEDTADWESKEFVQSIWNRAKYAGARVRCAELCDERRDRNVCMSTCLELSGWESEEQATE